MPLLQFIPLKQQETECPSPIHPPKTTGNRMPLPQFIPLRQQETECPSPMHPPKTTLQTVKHHYDKNNLISY
jgi:hypothetical protein